MLNNGPIDFFTEHDIIYMRYRVYMEGKAENWLKKALEEMSTIRLKKTFHVSDAIMKEKNATKEKDEEMEENEDYEDYEDTYFEFARKKGKYYKVGKDIITHKIDVYFHKDVVINIQLFIIDSDISIFSVIERLVTKDIYIGGEHPQAIQEAAFLELIEKFPNSYERKRYVEARVAGVLRNYIDEVKDAQSSFERYVNKKIRSTGTNIIDDFREYEITKYERIHERLIKMLQSEDEYSERTWQLEIIQIIILLFPKYIAVFKDVPVRAQYAESIKERELDFLLLDCNGNCDVVEIKKPFENSIMTKSVYRDNFIPLRELSGTVMQIEKYIYYLNRWSYLGEQYLTKTYKDELPENFHIKITNPNGLIIMGRENNLSPEQKLDFEVIKRKYKHVLDIITYDNLLDRLKITLQQLRKSKI
jgi:hypothetical protein